MTSPGGGQNIVGQSQMLAMADQLDDLKVQAMTTLDRYYQQSVELQAAGHLDGQAGRTNVVTAEEIQQAQMRIQHKWDMVINNLRSTSHAAGDTDAQSASSIASVSGGLRFT